MLFFQVLGEQNEILLKNNKAELNLVTKVVDINAFPKYLIVELQLHF